MITKSKNETSFAMNASYEYDAFGNLMNDTGGSEVYDNPFRYNGQYHDDETGLIYLRNRYYDPQTGRFTQEDPIKSGLNWYAYCGNNPVRYSDFWGLKPGEKFYDPDDAVKDFLIYLREELGWTGQWEYATAIYEDTEKGAIYYSYTEPVTIEDKDNVRIDYTVPKGTEYVGYAHTHPDDNHTEGFSGPDKNNTLNDSYAYVLLPIGNISKIYKNKDGYLENYDTDTGGKASIRKVSNFMPAKMDSTYLPKKLRELKMTIDEYNEQVKKELQSVEDSKRITELLIWEKGVTNEYYRKEAERINSK